MSKAFNITDTVSSISIARQSKVVYGDDKFSPSGVYKEEVHQGTYAQMVELMDSFPATEYVDTPSATVGDKETRTSLTLTSAGPLCTLTVRKEEYIATSSAAGSEEGKAGASKTIRSAVVWGDDVYVSTGNTESQTYYGTPEEMLAKAQTVTTEYVEDTSGSPGTRIIRQSANYSQSSPNEATCTITKEEYIVRGETESEGEGADGWLSTASKSVSVSFNETPILFAPQFASLAEDEVKALAALANGALESDILTGYEKISNIVGRFTPTAHIAYDYIKKGKTSYFTPRLEVTYSKRRSSAPTVPENMIRDSLPGVDPISPESNWICVGVDWDSENKIARMRYLSSEAGIKWSSDLYKPAKNSTPSTTPQ